MPLFRKSTQLSLLARAVALGALAFAIGGLQGCGGGGGGSSSGAPAAPPAAALAGAWTGTDPDSNTLLYALVLPNTGQVRFGTSTNSSEGSGTFTLSGTTLGGTLTGYPSSEDAATGDTPTTGTVTGTASAAAINATLASGSTPAEPLPVLTPDAAANIPVQLSALAGNYTQTGPSGTTVQVSVPNGATTATLTGTVPGVGTMAGSLVQVAPNLNAFKVTFTLTPSSGGTALPTFTGVVYLRPGATTTTAVLLADNGQIGGSGIFTLQQTTSTLAGAWTGTTRLGAATVYSLVLPSGAINVCTSDDIPEVLSGTLALSGTNLSGTLTTYPALTTLPTPTPAQGTLAGSAFPAAINMTLTINGLTTPFPSSTPDAMANVPIQLSALEGNYAQTGSSGVTFQVTVPAGSTTANLNGTIPGVGTFSGFATQAAPNLNAFSVVYTITLASGTLPNPTYTGVAYLRPGSPTTAILMTNNTQTGIGGTFNQTP